MPTAFDGPFVREVALSLPVPAAQAVEAGRTRGVLLGVDAGRVRAEWANLLLVAATEKRTKDEIDRWADALAFAVGAAGTVGKGGAR